MYALLSYNKTIHFDEKIIMKLKKARTCEGCKALYQSQGEDMKCLLGFGKQCGGKIRIVTPPEGGCPKPMTVHSFVDIKRSLP